MSPPRQLKLGVIGLAEDWDVAYRPALQRLAERGGVVTLHVDGRRRGEEAARQIGATLAGGIRQLLRQPTDGLIVTATGWYGWFPVWEALRAGVPCYTVIPGVWSSAGLQRLQEQAAENGLLVMPELRLRYTPATLRLRELLATEIGPVHRIVARSLADIAVSTARIELELLDWCRMILGRQPQTIESQNVGEGGPAPRRWTQLTWRAGSGGGSAPTAALDLSLTGAADAAPEEAPPGQRHAADVWPLELLVKGKYGEARLEDAVHLRWRCGGRERVESLSVERPATAIAIDHFARRLAGGLIPVPDLGDLLRAAQVLEAAEQSRQRREPVTLP